MIREVNSSLADQKTVTAFERLAFNQRVAVLAAKMGNINHRQGVSGFNQYDRTGLNVAQMTAGSENWKRAFQPL